MLEYLSDNEACEVIIEIGKRLYARGLVAANDGNISARVSNNEIWATPTNVSKGFMSRDMLVKIDINGNVLSGALKPSSEIKMHLAVYKRSSEVRGVVHAHPPVSSAFATAGMALDTALLQEAVVALGVIPVAPFAMPGSPELADGAAAFCPEYNGCLLENHGAVTWGNTPMQALFRLESLEHTATVYMYAKTMNIIHPMSDENIDKLIKLRPAWGINSGGRPKGNN